MSFALQNPEGRFCRVEAYFTPDCYQVCSGLHGLIIVCISDSLAFYVVLRHRLTGFTSDSHTLRNTVSLKRVCMLINNFS